MTDEVAVSREGWLKKRPTPQATKPWKESTMQRRFFVTRGNHVQYYTSAKRKPGQKPNGSFDLRRVMLIRPLGDRDPTAGPFVLDVEVQTHKIAIEFGFLGEMREWLRFWIPAIADHAIPAEWELGQAMKASASAELLEAFERLGSQELAEGPEEDADAAEPQGADLQASEEADRLAALEDQLVSSRPKGGLLGAVAAGARKLAPKK